MRDDRDHLLAQVQSLTMEVAECKEISGKSSKSLETITARAALLEVCTPKHQHPCFAILKCDDIFVFIIHRRHAFLKVEKLNSCDNNLLFPMRN